MSDLLALDLSTGVGFARFRQRGKKPTFGSFELEGPDLAWKLGQFGDWLDEGYSLDPWRAMAWERPILADTDTPAKLELLYGLVGICYRFAGARAHRMPWREVTVQEVKKTMTGRSNAKKPEMIAAARKVAWWVHNDHEADACGVGAFAYGRLFPKQGAIL